MDHCMLLSNKWIQLLVALNAREQLERCSPSEGTHSMGSTMPFPMVVTGRDHQQSQRRRGNKLGLESSRQQWRHCCDVGLRFMQELGPGRIWDMTVTRMPWSPCLVTEASGHRAGHSPPVVQPCRDKVRAVLAGRSKTHTQAWPEGMGAGCSGRLRPLGAPWGSGWKFCRFHNTYVYNTSQTCSALIARTHAWEQYQYHYYLFSSSVQIVNGSAHRILEYDVERAKCAVLYIFLHRYGNVIIL